MIVLCLDIHSIVCKDSVDNADNTVLSMDYTSFQQHGISRVNRFHGECLLR